MIVGISTNETDNFLVITQNLSTIVKLKADIVSSRQIPLNSEIYVPYGKDLEQNSQDLINLK